MPSRRTQFKKVWYCCRILWRSIPLALAISLSQSISFTTVPGLCLTNSVPATSRQHLQRAFLSRPETSCPMQHARICTALQYAKVVGVVPANIVRVCIAMSINTRRQWALPLPILCACARAGASVCDVGGPCPCGYIFEFRCLQSFCPSYHNHG